jgi:hypothetical protein
MIGWDFGSICTLFNEVRSNDFAYHTNPESILKLDRVKKDESQKCGPYGNDECSEQLYAKKGRLTGSENSLLRIEDTSGQYGPEATEAMHLCGVQWIINLKFLEHLARLRVYYAANKAYDAALPDEHTVAGGWDWDEASDDGVA